MCPNLHQLSKLHTNTYIENIFYICSHFPISNNLKIPILVCDILMQIFTQNFDCLAHFSLPNIFIKFQDLIHTEYTRPPFPSFSIISLLFLIIFQLSPFLIISELPPSVSVSLQFPSISDHFPAASDYLPTVSPTPSHLFHPFPNPFQ